MYSPRPLCPKTYQRTALSRSAGLAYRDCALPVSERRQRVHELLLYRGGPFPACHIEAPHCCQASFQIAIWSAPQEHLQQGTPCVVQHVFSLLRRDLAARHRYLRVAEGSGRQLPAGEALVCLPREKGKWEGQLGYQLNERSGDKGGGHMQLTTGGVAADPSQATSEVRSLPSTLHFSNDISKGGKSNAAVD